MYRLRCCILLFDGKSVLAYLDSAGKGYAQSAFEAFCPFCEETFNKEHLAVTKFARDLVLDHRDSQYVARYGNGVYLAYVSSDSCESDSHGSCHSGTVRTAIKADDTVKAGRIKDKLRVAHPLERPPDAVCLIPYIYTVKLT